MQRVVYGPGGYDPGMPNDNIIAVEEVEDDPTITAEERIAQLEATVQALLSVLAGG